MSFLNIFHLLALLLAPILGLLVYVTNRARASNLFFLIFSIIMAAWLGFLGAAFYLSEEVWIARCIRGACMVSVFAAFTFNGLRVALLNPGQSSLRIVRTTWPFLAATVFAATICTTRFFLQECHLVARSGHRRTPLRPRHRHLWRLSRGGPQLS
jgi:hypothetical protein